MLNALITETKSFDFNKQRYEIFISYNSNHYGYFQPLYFLDANTQQASMLDCEISNRNENILYVGIGYQDGVDINRARTRDYTIPSLGTEFNEGGGAELFYKFITTCVKPWIESRYLIKKDKQTLAGHSHGGHFVLFTALNHPKEFQNYLAASPSIWWGDGKLIPDGKLTLDNEIRKLTIMIGEFEEKLHPKSNDTERAQILNMNLNPKLRARNLAQRLLNNEQCCDFIVCSGRRHPGVIKDYVRIARFIAANNPHHTGL
ncbi:TPA: alpha/beta hydrolase [Serratia marcescens]|nr:alpha/beta hydrolase [Serratia marcescens]